MWSRSPRPDLKAAIGLIVRQAKAGESWAIKELLDRTLGRPDKQPEISELVDPDAAARVLRLQFPD